MGFLTFTNTNNQSISIETLTIVAYYADSTNVTTIIAGGVSYYLKISSSAFATIIGNESPYSFAEFNDLKGKKINFRMDSVDSYRKESVTATVVVINGVSLFLSIDYSTFQTIINLYPQIDVLAASTPNDLTDFYNSGISQQQFTNFVVDRKAENIGALEIIVETPLTPAGGWTFTNIVINSEDCYTLMEVVYDGTNTAIGTYPINFKFKMGDVFLRTITKNINVQP